MLSLSLGELEGPGHLIPRLASPALGLAGHISRVKPVLLGQLDAGDDGPLLLREWLRLGSSISMIFLSPLQPRDLRPCTRPVEVFAKATGCLVLIAKGDEGGLAFPQEPVE
jgi:hypothetical protein